jgi:hypothetical protein
LARFCPAEPAAERTICRMKLMMPTIIASMTNPMKRGKNPAYGSD